MPIFLPPKSLATNQSSAIDLYAYRKKYKKDVLVDKQQFSRPPEIGTADLWYDRNLYGKIDRKGNIIVARESQLRSLQTKDNRTYYTLNFISIAYNQLMLEMKTLLKQNSIPNQKTILRALSPVRAWEGQHQPYHKYMVGLFDMFVLHLEAKRIEHRISNFNEFVEEFFIHIRNNVAVKGSPFTFSSFIASNLAPANCSGLMIDLARARPSEDLPKQDIFVGDINFNNFKKLANKFGFVIDRNMPWRLIANLNSESMQIMMAQPVFDVTYQYGPKNVFDNHYRKTFILDYSLIRNYMYAMYDSLLQYKSKYTESKFYVCKNNVGGLLDKNVYRKELTDHEKNDVYTYENYWMEKVFRFRLLELKHDLEEQDIKQIIKRAKALYRSRSPDHAYGYLNKITKVYFLSEYNRTRVLAKSGIHKTPARNLVITYAK